MEEAVGDAPEPSPVGTEDNPADLGVLLVHGIGQSHSGDTLSRFGEPLVRWILDWVGQYAPADVEVTDAVLGVEADADPSTPAHTRLTLSAPASDTSVIRTSHWLIAESWWAQSFPTPSFRDLVVWCVQVVPWTAFLHFHRRLRRASAKLASARHAKRRDKGKLLSLFVALSLEFLAVLVALLAGPVVVMLLTLLLMLGLLPVPSLRRFVGWLQRGLAATIGDSYALLGPPIGSAAIYGRVHREMDWLSRRCRRVAVVAHSQGAAIAYHVVATRGTEKNRLLITFGAGIRKLAQIKLLQQTSSSWVWLSALAVTFFVIATLISRATLGIWSGLLLTLLVPLSWVLASVAVGVLLGIAGAVIGRKWNAAGKLSERLQLVIGLALMGTTIAAFALWMPSDSRVSTVWVTVLVTLAWGWVLQARAVAGEDARRIPIMLAPETGRARPATEPALPPGVRWIDLYAASDPVPNGAIFDEEEPDPVELRTRAHELESVIVANRGSLLLDHTSYWHNPEDFVSEVAAALGSVCGLNLSNVLPLDDRRLTVARHRRRWRVSWLRWSRLPVLGSVAAIWLWADTARFTETMLAWLSAVAGAMPLVGEMLDRWLPDSVSVSPLGEAAACSVLLFTALGLVRACWLLWDRRDRRSLIDRRGYPEPSEPGLPALPFHLSWLLALALAPILIFQWTSWPLWAYALGLAGLSIAAGGVTGAADTWGYTGNILKAWPQLLLRQHRWNERKLQQWEQERRENMMAVLSPDSRGAAHGWSARTVLVWHVDDPESTPGHEQSHWETLYDAAVWSRNRVDRVYASLGDGNHVPVNALFAGGGNVAPAMDFWTRVIASDLFGPAQRAEAHLSRGLLSQQQAAHPQAIADFSAALAIAEILPRDRAMALNHRGVCLAASDQTDAALADHEAVLAMDNPPTSELANALAARGWWAYQRGDQVAFLRDTELAMKEEPESPWIRFNLALASLLSGAAERARSLYTTGLESTDAAVLAEAIGDLEDARPQLGDEAVIEAILEQLGARLAELKAQGESGPATTEPMDGPALFAGVRSTSLRRAGQR